MCWSMTAVRELHYCVSVAGCLGYDVLAGLSDSANIALSFQLLVV